MEAFLLGKGICMEKRRQDWPAGQLFDNKMQILLYTISLKSIKIHLAMLFAFCIILMCRFAKNQRSTDYQS